MFLADSLYYSDEEVIIKKSLPPPKKNVNCIDVYKKIHPSFNSSYIYTMLTRHPNMFPMVLNYNTLLWEYHWKNFKGCDEYIVHYNRIQIVNKFLYEIKTNLIQRTWKRIFSKEVLQEMFSVVLHPDNFNLFRGWGIMT